MKMEQDTLGIDVGGLFFKAVRVSPKGRITRSFYRRHKNEPAQMLEEAFQALGATGREAIGLAGPSAQVIADHLGLPCHDIISCQIEALKVLDSKIKFIIDIGGLSSTLIQVDRRGNLRRYATNSLCAAGTGSFLDEQAARLGFSCDALNDCPDVIQPPSIATRCSVFAKSDLIHRQQEGYSREEMWCGLCRGMARNLLNTLLRGRPLDGMTALTGGGALNKQVVRWLKASCPGHIEIPRDPHLFAALGAALRAQRPPREVRRPVRIPLPVTPPFERCPWPLTLEKSIYPSFTALESHTDEWGNDVRLTRWPAAAEVPGYLGIDVGSTSTKAVFIDVQGNVVLDIYRRTAGNPIEATQLIFKAIGSFSKRAGRTLQIRGAGTTGSGRKIVGAVIGADAVVNEISAHVRGALHNDPQIDTIFEIGGQDSKYMHLVGGHIRDASMNYVCAAGTGSFIEELAKKLGHEIAEAGPAIMGIHPPLASDRCTVFMEQDLANLIQSGATPNEAFAAIMVSVARNYLNKVVGNRPLSRKKIFFQGATARNPALVAAFERLLGVEIVVSPYCHVMGALGVSLEARATMQKRGHPNSTFRGLDLENRSIALKKETCRLCGNHCAITHADIEGSENGPSWGYMCGRDPDESHMRVSPHTRLLRKRRQLWLEGGKGLHVPKDAPVVGIPQSLATYIHLPLWRRFFNALGYRIRLSGETAQDIREAGMRLAGADFCFPAKVFLGHAANLVLKDHVDFLFLPQMVGAKTHAHVTNSTFCPYVQAMHACTKTAFQMNGIDTRCILAALVDMRPPDEIIAGNLAQTLSAPLQRSSREILSAWLEGARAQRQFEKRCLKEGETALKEALDKKEKMIVLLGRPYIVHDAGMNLDLPQKVAERGRTIIPLDFLHIDLSQLNARYRNTYWSYGQKILGALQMVAANPLLDAVCLTNYGCGPDSFLLSYAEEIMGNKPFLTLELDEHTADVGFMTRIEAYFDVLEKQKPRCRPPKPLPPPSFDFKERLIWVPNMHPHATEFLAAAFRKNGYRAQRLPLETRESFELGRSLTRGSECLPTALTIGSLVKVLREKVVHGPQAFFMPTAQGPCRFGQYCTLHRQILDREGFGDVTIMSPNSLNGYQGIDESVRRTFWKGLLAGDILLKIGCRTRPYEITRGETNRRLQKQVQIISHVLERDGNLAQAVKAAVRDVASVPTCRDMQKPLVGIVGEIYVRNNSYANENLIESLEAMGAEVWMAPLAEWLLFTSSPANVLQSHGSRFTLNAMKSYLKWEWMRLWEKRLYACAAPFLDDRHEPPVMRVLKLGGHYLHANIGGEAILSLGRAIEFARQKVAMLVNVAPFNCMPGTVTSALFRLIASEHRLPIVNLFYDGMGGQNKKLGVFLRNAAGVGVGDGAPGRECPLRDCTTRGGK